MPREKNFEYYQNLAAMLIDQDADRDSAYEDYRDMYHLKFSLPEVLQKLPWVRNVVSSAPHDAVSAAKRVLSSVKPQPRYQPLDNTQQSKDRAAEIENLLMWQLYGVNTRKGTTIVADIVESALLYMSVAAMVIDLDYHIKQMEALGRDTKQLKRARKKGRFVVNVYNPSSVHVRKTSMGNEATLLHVKRSAIDVLEEWGDPDGTLMDIADSNGDVTYYDLYDWENRCVWISGERPEQVNTGYVEKSTPVVHTIELLPPTEHGLDFSPWVAALGDSALEEEAEHKYHPLLYAVRRSRSWETLNITQSLAISEEISKAARPDIVEEGANLDTTEIDYTDAAKIAKVPTGNTLKSLGKPGMDQGKTEIIDRIRSEMEQSTVSSVLQGGSIASNVAFASLNLSTQMAVGALKPSKELAENAIAEIFKLMLLWGKATGIPLEGYVADMRQDGYGSQLMAKVEEYTEEDLYITVELTPDVPTDRQQRANAAGMMIQWGYPKEYALEDVGVTDPGKAMATSAFEQMQENKIALELQREQAELQLKIQDLQFQQQMKQQQAQMDMQMQQQQAAQQAMQQQQGGMQGGMQGPPTSQMPPDPALMAQMSQGPMPGGQAFDTGSGGLPPGMANPEGGASPMGGTDKEGQPMLDLEGMLAGQGETLAG